jgi:hypothetical protein
VGDGNRSGALTRPSVTPIFGRETRSRLLGSSYLPYSALTTLVMTILDDRTKPSSCASLRHRGPVPRASHRAAGRDQEPTSRLAPAVQVRVGAIDPDALDGQVEDELAAVRDRDAYDAALAVEPAERLAVLRQLATTLEDEA